jgi:ubiquinone biosynthesis UbiH/UbiF/VisC/COQ6 family hydroxylase
VQAVPAMHIAADGAKLEFNASEQRLEALAWIVESDAIERALDLALQFERGVRVSAARVERAEPAAAGWDLQFAGGARLGAALLVGADGRGSRVLEWAGIGQRSKPYEQTAIVCNFLCTGTHRGVAWQRFGAEGVVALLPLPARDGGDQVSLVWSAPDALARELQGLDAHALAQRVQDQLPGLGAQGLGTLTPAGTVGAWPLVRQRAHSLIGAGVALLGDAAHVVHPLAGHGLNLGLQDVQALAAVLQGRGAAEAPGDGRVLRRYARARAEQVLALELATDALCRLYAPGLEWLGPLRAFGLSATNHLVPLKRLLAGYASGLAVLS